VAANGARFDHVADGAGGWRCRGLLVETGATNRLRVSAPIAPTVWGYSGTATNIGNAAAPDGSEDGRLVRLSAGGGGSVYVIESGMPPGAIASLSIWMRRPAVGGAPAVRVTTNNGSGWNSGASIQVAPGLDWARHVLSGALTPGSSVGLLIGSFDVAGAFDPLCSGDVAIWGAQLEVGGMATSLIRTSGSAQSRAADVLTLDWGSKGVADGTRTVRYRFDDGSHADLPAQISGGLATVPTPLPRTALAAATLI